MRKFRVTCVASLDVTNNATVIAREEAHDTHPVGPAAAVERPLQGVLWRDLSLYARADSEACWRQVALRWFCNRSLLRDEGLTKELIDRIPGKQTDRRTPLGELNWIFTAITDTIAWNMLPRALFQKLFRQVRRQRRLQACRWSANDLPADSMRRQLG